MATITITYDGRSASAKSLLAFLRTLSFIRIGEENADNSYDPEMVAKIERGREAFRKGECVTVKAEEIWN